MTSPTTPEGVGLTVPEVLNAAADLLEKPGAWTQGTFARDRNGERINTDSPDAVCWCVAGALMSFSGRGQWIEAQYALTRALGRLPDWNDDPNRTQAEVVAALRQAATQSAGETS